ncbi:lipoprotein [Caballeronia fortuita]|uniref:Lipoprotein n=1 Tax=Caballeronia fortuita TaxID=1777138 RepID=A0A158C2Q5_9BURK|nr:lipoprotein [Caballeronia fortuita]
MAVLVAMSLGLFGCGLAAAPCRIASAGLKIVPVVGHVAAAPTDACADVIDP